MTQVKTFYVKENSLIQFTNIQSPPKDALYLWTHLGDSADSNKAPLRPDYNPASKNDNLYIKRVEGWKNRETFTPLFYNIFQTDQIDNAYVNLFENDKNTFAQTKTVTFGYQTTMRKTEFKARFIEISQDISFDVKPDEKITAHHIFNFAKTRIQNLHDLEVTDIDDIYMGNFGKNGGTWKFDNKTNQNKDNSKEIIEESKLLNSSPSNIPTLERLKKCHYLGCSSKVKELGFIKFTTKNNKEYTVGIEFNNLGM